MINGNSEVLFSQQGACGVIELNRPNALNALNENMCAMIYAQLIKWRDDVSIGAVIIKGAGERAFCAGGDIRWMYDTSREDPERAAGFFRVEYKLNSLIYQYPKPYIALLHGVVMGGGVGVSISADYSMIAHDAIWAMPETGIGLIPDVGGSFFLPRLREGLGHYLALTGRRLNGADCVSAGISTHLVEKDNMSKVEHALCALSLQECKPHQIADILDQHADTLSGAIAEDFEEIETLFSKFSDFEELMRTLQNADKDLARDALKRLSRMSPTSMLLTIEAIKRGADSDFDRCLENEFGIVRKLMDQSDFHEGVRAQIVDKDRNPKWHPENMTLISDAFIDAFFEDLGEDALDLSHPT